MHASTPSSRPRRALVIGCGIAGPVVALALRRAGLEASVHEAQPGPSDDAGAFLNVAPNGVNALRALGLEGVVERAGAVCRAFSFHNHQGRTLGGFDLSADVERYGAAQYVLRRGELTQGLREAALAHGVRVEFGRRLQTVRVHDAGVVARFEDGTETEGDLLVGCDGVHSPTRRALFPAAPGPTYGGLLDCGGFSRPSRAPGPPGAFHMFFGRRAFFSYFVRPDGEVYWFNNTPRPREPSREELRALNPHEWRERLLELHAEDPPVIREVLEAGTGPVGVWPLYDLASPPRWHLGRAVLVGDAAHAMPPHAGQGASMSVEDALVLADCLRQHADVAHAFADFEARRRSRVERIAQQARRHGSRKVAGPVAAWLRDRLMPMFLRHGERANVWVHGYRVAA